MSRVERIDNPNDHGDTKQLRQAERGGHADTPRSDPNPGTTPTKAEGELGDIEEALRHQSEE